VKENPAKPDRLAREFLLSGGEALERRLDIASIIWSSNFSS